MIVAILIGDIIVIGSRALSIEDTWATHSSCRRLFQLIGGKTHAQIPLDDSVAAVLHFAIVFG